MPASNGTDAFKPGIALGDNRRLHLGRPLAPLARAREYLEPLRALAHRIITRDYHSSSPLPHDQRAKNRRYASTAQGGRSTTLTDYRRSNAGPFAGIDPLSIVDIKQMVRDLRKHGVGVLITDHNVHEMLELIDRAYIIHDGKVLFEGT